MLLQLGVKLKVKRSSNYVTFCIIFHTCLLKTLHLQIRLQFFI